MFYRAAGPKTGIAGSAECKRTGYIHEGTVTPCGHVWKFHSKGLGFNFFEQCSIASIKNDGKLNSFTERIQNALYDFAAEIKLNTKPTGSFL